MAIAVPCGGTIKQINDINVNYVTVLHMIGPVDAEGAVPKQRKPSTP